MTAGEMNVALRQRSPCAIATSAIVKDIGADKALAEGRPGAGKLAIDAWEEHE